MKRIESSKFREKMNFCVPFMTKAKTFAILPKPLQIWTNICKLGLTLQLKNKKISEVKTFLTNEME